MTSKVVEKKLFSRKDAAKKINCSEPTIYKATLCGKLPICIVPNKKRAYYLIDDLLVLKHELLQSAIYISHQKK